MILASLKDYRRVESLHPLFKIFFEYILNNDFNKLDLGKHIISGEDLFINNINPKCLSQQEQVLELHHDYIDIHVLLEGKERIGWKAMKDLKNMVKPYSKEEDCALYKEEASSYVDLLPGQFAIMFPEDAHAPVIGEGNIRKLIGKVRCIVLGQSAE